MQRKVHTSGEPKAFEVSTSGCVGQNVSLGCQFRDPSVWGSILGLKNTLVVALARFLAAILCATNSRVKLSMTRFAWNCAPWLSQVKLSVTISAIQGWRVHSHCDKNEWFFFVFALSILDMLILLISEGDAPKVFKNFPSKEPTLICPSSIFLKCQAAFVRAPLWAPKNQSIVTSTLHTIFISYIHKNSISKWDIITKRKPEEKWREEQCLQMSVNSKFKKYLLSQPTGAHANLRGQKSITSPNKKILPSPPFFSLRNGAGWYCITGLILLVLSILWMNVKPRLWILTIWSLDIFFLFFCLFVFFLNRRRRYNLTWLC